MSDGANESISSVDENCGEKRSFWGRVHFFSFPHGRDRGDLDRVENQLYEHFVVCSSFISTEGV